MRSDPDFWLEQLASCSMFYSCEKKTDGLGRWWGVKPWGKKSRIPGKNVKFKNHMRNISEDVKKSICKSRLDILGENWAG